MVSETKLSEYVPTEHETFTITFGNIAENHVGMQKIGVLANAGFNLDDLKRVQGKFKTKGCETEIVHLNRASENTGEDAYILVVRNAVDAILEEVGDDKKGLFNELRGLSWDTKMRGQVVHKHARWNLIFDEKEQKANFDEGKGRVVAWHDVLLLSYFGSRIEKIIGPVAGNLKAESNYYYDSRKTYIGFHGDSERKKVVAIRLGKEIPLFYQWFYRGNPVGHTIQLNIRCGDMYIMSEKASGWDWKRSSQYTLRHAAGEEKIIQSKFKLDK